MQILLITVAILALFAFAHFYDAKQRNDAWTLVAKRLGLSFPSDAIAGKLEGVELSVRTISRGVGKSRQDFTVIMLKISGTLPAGISIEPEKALDKLAKLIGSEDIQLGLPTLDSKLLVRASNENKIRSWAKRPGVERALRRLVTLSSYTFHVTGGHLIFERRGIMTNAKDLESLIRELVAITRDFSQVPKPQESLDSSRADEDDVSLW